MPVTDAQVWKDEREFWFQLDAPRHLFIPNTQSIRLLARRFGLELYKVEFDSSGDQFLFTELYKRGKPLEGTEVAKEFSKEKLADFGRKAAQYNQQKIGDQACFYLKKRQNTNMQQSKRHLST